MRLKLPTLILLLALVLTAMASAAPSLPFISDDYAKARAEAIRRNLPLFIEVGAAW